MRDLLEVTIECTGCAGRVAVHLDARDHHCLAGRCARCGAEVACTVHPQPAVSAGLGALR